MLPGCGNAEPGAAAGHGRIGRSGVVAFMVDADEYAGFRTAGPVPGCG